MASLSAVLLHIAEKNGNAFIEISYRVDPTGQDLAHQEFYSEVVDLIGMDTGLKEDGLSEPIASIHIGQLRFGPTQQFFSRTWSTNLPSGVLDEDPGPPVREDEIRARVRLAPLPSVSIQKHSNLVRRGGLAGAILQ